MTLQISRIAITLTPKGFINWVTALDLRVYIQMKSIEVSSYLKKKKKNYDNA